MVARNRTDPKAPGLLTEFPLSKHALTLGRAILRGGVGRGIYAKTARVFCGRADARNAAFAKRYARFGA